MALRLPGVSDEREERVICHVDVDCFYAACERLREPELAGEPVVVGMGYEPGETHGAVATASYEARKYGIESAQSLSRALELLPPKERALGEADLDPDEAGYYRPVDMDFYEEVAEDVKAVLHDAADVVREVSIDEAYLDITGNVSWDCAEAFAAALKTRIDEAAGVTASVGVAPNMATAKVASDRDKPDGLVVVKPGEAREFLAPLPVRELHGVGPVTARELGEMGIETAGGLASAEAGELEARFGERGREIFEHARGHDDREVEPVGDPKSLNRESAFTEATADCADKRERVRALAADVAERASVKGALYRTIGIKVVTPPYDVHTRAHSLPGPVDKPALVEEVALDLLGEFNGREVRKLGVRVANLSFADADQASLDSWGGSGGDGSGDGNKSDPVSSANDAETRSGGDLDRDGPRGQTTFRDFE